MIYTVTSATNLNLNKNEFTFKAYYMLFYTYDIILWISYHIIYITLYKGINTTNIIKQITEKWRYSAEQNYVTSQTKFN